MKPNYLNKRSTSTLIFLICATLATTGTATKELTYRIENFSHQAHRRMDDHGVNALYLVNINNVDKFLPEDIDIKRTILRRINHYFFPGRAAIKLFRHRRLDLEPTFRHASSQDFFGAFREGIPHTYVVLKDRLIFTESTGVPLDEKSKDRYSKHYIISKMSDTVRFAGEFFVFKNKKNKEVFLVFDNASGTFQPKAEVDSESGLGGLDGLQALLEHNFIEGDSGLHFVTKSFDQKIDKKKLFKHEKNPFQSKI